MVVDLFANPPIAFEALWDRAVRMRVGSAEIRIAAIPDLVRMKELAGRPKDQEDVCHLLRIQERETK